MKSVVVVVVVVDFFNPLLPCRELTYPTNEKKGNSSSQLPFGWDISDMLVPGRVTTH